MRGAIQNYFEKTKQYPNYYSNEELDVKVKNVGVDYFTDTKGYYQPVYVFNVDMNGEETQIDIPALKK